MQASNILKISEIKLVEAADVPIIKICFMGTMIDISLGQVCINNIY